MVSASPLLTSGLRYGRICRCTSPVDSSMDDHTWMSDTSHSNVQRPTSNRVFESGRADKRRLSLRLWGRAAQHER